MSMKKMMAALVLISASVFLCGDLFGDELKLIAEDGGGKLYQAGKFKVVELAGTYREMGRQYGALLKDDIVRFYRVAVEETFIKELGTTVEAMEGITKSFYDLSPDMFREFTLGMAAGSGLSVEKVLILNQIEAIVALIKETHCTGIAAWGPYTSGNPLVFGRTFDYPDYFKKFSEFLTVVVYKPSGEINSAATITYVGDMATINGMNSAGLFFELNDGSRSGGRVFIMNRTPFLSTLFSSLFDSSSLQQFDAMLNAVRTEYPAIVNVSDGKTAYSYECSAYDTRRREAAEDGFLYATNHFINKSWGLGAPLGDTSSSMERWANLGEIGKKYKGQFSPDTMMNILDVNFDAGGVTMPYTIYMFVYVPEQLKLWLKAQGYSGWTEIGLKPLMSKEQ